MLFKVTALTNNAAKLIVKTMESSDYEAAEVIKTLWESQGYKVLFKEL
jgi:hypothetical protein